MLKRKLGNSDLVVSQVGLGCMSIGTDEKKALAIIDEAIELGINYLDTADLYDQGLNEQFVGKAIKNRRQDIILATKVGNRMIPGKSRWTWDPSKAYIKTEVKESLRRLQTDYIDLYQLHGGTIEDNIDETIEAFEELKAEGIIRYYGISSIRPNVIEQYVKKSSITSIMMQYSILDRRAEELFPLLKEHGISVVARGPVAKGLLTDKTKVNQGWTKGYESYQLDELTETITGLLNKFGATRSLTEVALQYCLTNEVVASVVTGASSIEQVRENIIAGTHMPLTADEIQMIQSISKSSNYEQHRIN